MMNGITSFGLTVRKIQSGPTSRNYIRQAAAFSIDIVIKDQQQAAAFSIDIVEDGTILACKRKIQKLDDDNEKGRGNDRDLAWNTLQLLREMDRNLYKLITAK